MSRASVAFTLPPLLPILQHAPVEVVSQKWQHTIQPVDARRAVLRMDRLVRAPRAMLPLLGTHPDARAWDVACEWTVGDFKLQAKKAPW